MRAYSAAVLAAMRSRAKRATVFVECQFESGTQRYTLWNAALPWDGFTWAAAGGLVQISPMRETSGEEIVGWQIGLSPLSTSQNSLFLQENIKGRTCKAWLAMLDESYAVIPDPELFFAGEFDAPSREINEESVGVITAPVESYHAQSKRSNDRRYTDADQQARYPGDRVFEYLPSMVEKRLDIGRKADGTLA